MKYLFNIVLATITILMLNSCLKKRETTLDGDGPSNVVEFKNTGSNNAAGTSFYPLFSQDLGIMQSGESKSFNVNVNYAGVNVAPSDITVELEVDQTALDRFNEENGTDYVIPPASVCSYPTSLVIKKGERVSTGEATVTLSADYDYSFPYALPLRIKNVSPSHTISGNFGAAMYSLNIRNDFDGIYSCVAGTIQRYSDPSTPTTDALNGSLAGNKDVTLTSAGLYTVEIGNLQWAANGGGIGGIDHLQATVDPSTNEVTMRALGNATLANTPGKENSYDPATRTYTLNFTWNPTSTKREVTGLVLRYKKDR